jgi:spore coat polysaccharide biosynthesis predicted glycosyltransferase SpsG
MIIFRADISPRTGLQHLRRCAYLAALLKKNNDVLVCSREDKKTAKFLAEHKIPAKLGKDPNIMDLAGVTAVISDLPHFSAPENTLLEKARKAGIKIIQIINGDSECQPADILLKPLTKVENPAAPGQIILSGPSYALLHHKFRHFNRVNRKYRKSIKNVFINLGDLFPYRDLRQVVDTLHRLHLKMKIAPGMNLKKADKRNLMKIYPGIHFCGKSESPARAYFEADLALVTPGEEALEAACVGTPALYMDLEKGHDTLSEARAGLGIGVKVPTLADFSVQSVRDAITTLDLETREKMGAAGKALVDGLGVQRFFKILKENGIIE